MATITPRAVIEVLERDPALPAGSGDRFSGWAIVGVPFQSGHLLALRRFVVSSIGPAYTSVWHRDPAGHWTFYATVAPDGSCARYYGARIDRTVVAPIDLEWPTPWTLHARIGRTLSWAITLGGTASTPLADSGRTPNGHRVVVTCRRRWRIDTSTARLHGRDLGRPGPLEALAPLDDLGVRRRRVCAVTDVSFERPTRPTPSSGTVETRHTSWSADLDPLPVTGRPAKFRGGCANRSCPAGLLVKNRGRASMASRRGDLQNRWR